MTAIFQLPTFIDTDQVAAMLGRSPAVFLAQRRELEDNHRFPLPVPHWKRPLKWRADAVEFWISGQGLPRAAADIEGQIDPALIAAGKVALIAEARRG